ncbi:MAG: DEAD/DEAH box helicase family protein [Ignavibacteriota bacterium]|nr:DEAD/DEAH box helicase [Ignavibacteriota bacterium]MCO6447977.1 DEAD/DEAH box helicase family protein [Ignavibacterium album]MCZ2268404.1 DEAD/DEAH box helicase family protein [Ignavibacteriales bacterium]QKJ98069.1 MAG: DEAD/DEAH box helicase family protein [Ignavibacteriota bacterium]HOJ06784.1 DEAD/DEAH box helicase family protein [Ignavibacteriaceae bacterium]
MDQKEAQARIKINKKLEKSGWRFFDEDDKSASIICEHRITKKKYKQDELGQDFENAENGFIDYLLLNNDKRPVALVEAKRESTNPLDAKEQAREYARSLNIRFIFLSNGNLHYYWDLFNGNPTRISNFLSLDELGVAQKWTPNPEAMQNQVIDENYIAVSQDSQWLTYSAEEKETARLNKGIKVLRDYQIDATKKIKQEFVKGKRRFLLEMATGTGKTLLSAAIIKMFIRSGNADRVLFLVDRLELERQAYKNLRNYLAKDSIESVIYKRKKDSWMSAQVVITTIQSLSYENRYLENFNPNDFQLIISDESHRTIGGNNRVIFEYFIGSKLGLTATPKNYLKGIDQAEMSENDPKQLEKRLLLDTYETFGCKPGDPTFSFSLIDAVNHKPPYLVNPRKLDGRTDVTTEVLSKEGWNVKWVNDEGEEEEDTFYKRDFERKFFSPETNKEFVESFLKKAKRDPITNEIGKTIFFAVSRPHAAKITKLLNEEIEKMYPGKYKSDFAVQVTSDIPGAQDMTVDFANNNFNGLTNFEPKFIDYKSSKTRVCVTVGMMTTGYDCEDILNVVLARPIFSPSLFVQIKGRGTRLYKFKFDDGSQRIEKDKDNYYLFDYFANCEYFDEYDYDEELEVPREPGTGGSGPPPPQPDKYVYTGPDEMKNWKETQIGLDGMRIDREAFSKSFENKTKEEVQKHPNLLEALNEEEWDIIEEHVKTHLFNKPQEYWNKEKLQEAYGIDRRLTLKEIILKALGKISIFKSRDDLADEYFERFLSAEGVDGSKYYELKSLFKAYLLFDDLRPLIDRREYAKLATDARLSLTELSQLGPEQIQLTVNYIKDNVPLNKFLPV